MHRDLKPANLMLGGIPPDVTDRSIAQRFGVCKIADFGLSKSLALRNDDSSKSRQKIIGELCEGNNTSEVASQVHLIHHGGSAMSCSFLNSRQKILYAAAI